MNRSVALLSIGRSPRPDIRSDIERGIGSGIRILEYGALDALDDAEARSLAPENDEDALIASLGPSGQAIVSKRAVGRLLQGVIDRIAYQVDGFGILCTGLFPDLRSALPIGQVGKLMLEEGARCRASEPIGVLMPIIEQVELNKELWSNGARAVLTAVASPYDGLAGVVDAAKKLRACGAAVIAMSCMTYSEDMRSAVAGSTGLPTIGPGRTLVDFINKEWNA